MHKFALRLELDVISLQKLDVPDDDDDKIQTYKMLSICQYINIYIISFHNIRIYMGDPSTVKKTHNSALILPSNIFGESLSVVPCQSCSGKNPNSMAFQQILWLGSLQAVTVTGTPTLPFSLLSACFSVNLLELVASPFTKSTSSQINKT